MTIESPPVCARCAKPLPENWCWAKDAEGFLSLAVCTSCAKPGEKAA